MKESRSHKTDRPPVDNDVLANMLRESAAIVERGDFDPVLYNALQDFRTYYKEHYPTKKGSSPSKRKDSTTKKKDKAAAAKASSSSSTRSVVSSGGATTSSVQSQDTPHKPVAEAKPVISKPAPVVEKPKAATAKTTTATTTTTTTPVASASLKVPSKVVHDETKPVPAKDEDSSSKEKQVPNPVPVEATTETASTGIPLSVPTAGSHEAVPNTPVSVPVPVPVAAPTPAPAPAPAPTPVSTPAPAPAQTKTHVHVQVPAAASSTKAPSSRSSMVKTGESSRSIGSVERPKVPTSVDPTIQKATASMIFGKFKVPTLSKKIPAAFSATSKKNAERARGDLEALTGGAMAAQAQSSRRRKADEEEWSSTRENTEQSKESTRVELAGSEVSNDQLEKNNSAGGSPGSTMPDHLQNDNTKFEATNHGANKTASTAETLETQDSHENTATVKEKAPGDNMNLHSTNSVSSRAKPDFQRPSSANSSLIANGWIEQQRRSKMRFAWKEVLASLVQGRKPGEETTLWIQREVINTSTGKRELEALHQLPLKLVESCTYLDYTPDNRFALKIFNAPEEFLFRCRSDQSAIQWVQILKKENILASGGSIPQRTREEEEKKETSPPARMSISELRAICHGAGINTAGMERRQLEIAADEVRKRGTFFPTPPNAPQPIPVPTYHGTAPPPPSTGPEVYNQPQPIGPHGPHPSNLSIKELRAICHGSGINTAGMERQQLEQAAEEVKRRGTFFPPPNAPRPPPPPPQPVPPQKSGSVGTTQSAPPTAPGKLSISELRAICHGAGIKTTGMERGQLERAADEVKRQGTYFPAPQKTSASAAAVPPPVPPHSSASAPDESEASRRREAEDRARQVEAARRHEAEERARREEYQRQQAHRRQMELEQQQQRLRQEQEQRRRQAEQQAAWQKQQQEEEHRRRMEAEQQRRRHEEAVRQQQWQQQQWHQQQQQQQQRQQWNQQQQPWPPQHPGGWQQQQQQTHPQPPPGRQHPQQQQQQQQHQSSASQKYAKMANATDDDGQAVITKIKHAILIQWALQPPQLQMLRPIEVLVTTIHKVFPPAVGVPAHDYFKKWKAYEPSDVRGAAGILDEEKLKKAVRKIRFFLHPDKLPKDLNTEQSFLVKMLWDVTSDAWEEYEKRKEDLDWIK